MIAQTIIYLLACAAVLPAAEEYSWWIDDCPPALARSSGCEAGDPELGRWALEAWQKSSAGFLQVKPVETERTARLRIYWVTGSSQLYGEARPIVFEGKRGSQVYVLPAAARHGEDPLDRETVVYLTCLHETGHALGLAHTANFEDIMYNFQYGGDIAEYFGRYARKLEHREDIRKHSGISPTDRKRLAAGL